MKLYHNVIPSLWHIRFIKKTLPNDQKSTIQKIMSTRNLTLKITNRTLHEQLIVNFYCFKNPTFIVREADKSTMRALFNLQKTALLVYS